MLVVILHSRECRQYSTVQRVIVCTKAREDSSLNELRVWSMDSRMER